MSASVSASISIASAMASWSWRSTCVLSPDSRLRLPIRAGAERTARVGRVQGTWGPSGIQAPRPRADPVGDHVGGRRQQQVGGRRQEAGGAAGLQVDAYK